MHPFASVVPQRALRASRISAAQIAALAEHSLRLEIETWPKPGLVSYIDAGSHSDMDAHTFYRSAAALRPFFAELTEAGERGDPMLTLRRIGLRAERAMLEATGGVNTHRGASLDWASSVRRLVCPRAVVLIGNCRWVSSCPAAGGETSLADRDCPKVTAKW